MACGPHCLSCGQHPSPADTHVASKVKEPVVQVLRRWPETLKVGLIPPTRPSSPEAAPSRKVAACSGSQSGRSASHQHFVVRRNPRVICYTLRQRGCRRWAWLLAGPNIESCHGRHGLPLPVGRVADRGGIDHDLVVLAGGGVAHLPGSAVEWRGQCGRSAVGHAGR